MVQFAGYASTMFCGIETNWLFPSILNVREEKTSGCYSACSLTGCNARVCFRPKAFPSSAWSIKFSFGCFLVHSCFGGYIALPNSTGRKTHHRLKRMQSPGDYFYSRVINWDIQQYHLLPPNRVDRNLMGLNPVILLDQLETVPWLRFS